LFLDHLAESSNVTASANAAGVTSSAIYRERRRNAEFAGRWHQALCEGFVRLETELLSEALLSANGNMKDATLKAKAQKYRLGLALLAAHRSAVRGVKSLGAAGAGETVAGVDGAEMKAKLAARLRAMRERVVPDGDAGVGGGFDGALEP
jgi:phosphoglycolate phosphatase-like HAD superfamily hydrolase